MWLFRPKFKPRLIFDGKQWAVEVTRGKFYDFKASGQYLWSRDNKYFADCWTSDQEKAGQILNRYKLLESLES